MNILEYPEQQGRTVKIISRASRSQPDAVVFNCLKCGETNYYSEYDAVVEVACGTCGFLAGFVKFDKFGVAYGTSKGKWEKFQAHKAEGKLDRWELRIKRMVDTGI